MKQWVNKANTSADIPSSSFVRIFKMQRLGMKYENKAFKKYSPVQRLQRQPSTPTAKIAVADRSDDPT
jgi:hypothetical protein